MLASMDLRTPLVEAGTRLLERDGPAALQIRKVAAEVGTSTMAVYTHFGGINGLVEAIIAAAFERFGAALASAPTTDDPMADLFAMGHAYRDFALASPQRYRLMFGLASPQLSSTAETPRMPVAAAAFDQLLNAVARIVASGRIRHDDVVEIAGRVWSMIHGLVLLEIVGQFGHDQHAFVQILGPMIVDMFVGMGDERQRAENSMSRAIKTMASIEK
jgi:AcrR family transcriptional regulator